MTGPRSLPGGGGGGYPRQVKTGVPQPAPDGGEGYHSQVQMGLSMMGYPLARSDQGVPQHGYLLSWDVIPPARSEWEYPRTRYPILGWDTPPPQPGQDGGTPGQGSPHNGMGSPLARSGQGTYPRMGYPHPGMGPPPVLGWGTPWLGQQKEYLLCGGRYASCVHAGGLSCSLIPLFCSLVLLFKISLFLPARTREGQYSTEYSPQCTHFILSRAQIYGE